MEEEIKDLIKKCVSYNLNIHWYVSPAESVLGITNKYEQCVIYYNATEEDILNTLKKFLETYELYKGIKSPSNKYKIFYESLKK